MATIIKSTSELQDKIAKIAKAGKQLDEAIQIAVVSCMWHIITVRQTTPLKDLIAAMPNGSRLTQLVEYVNRFFLFTPSDGKRPVELVRADRKGAITIMKEKMPAWQEFVANDPEGALARYGDASMWYEKGETGPGKAVDVTKRLETLTKAIQKYIEEDGEDCTPHMADSATLAALDALKAAVLRLEQHNAELAELAKTA